MVVNNRLVVHGDALQWLRANNEPRPIVTSPPDAYEIDWPVEKWRPWFQEALALCMEAADGLPAIFCVTDRKHAGRIESKAQMVLDAATATGSDVLWHKIVLRRTVSATDLHRPGFSHLIAVGGPTCRPGAATPDVFPRGKTLYPNGMGVDAAWVACKYLHDQGHTSLANPFCGRGTVLAVANTLGMYAVGIDNDREQVMASMFQPNL